MDTFEDIRVVVAERGGDWAVHAEDPCAPTLLILQQPEEALDDFVARVRDKLARVATGGRRLVDAVIVGGGRTDIQAMSSRSLMVRLMTAPLIAAGGGRLELVASGPERLGMVGLAATVEPMLEGSGVEVAALPARPAAQSAA